jgi:hypothetical protein
MLRIIDREHYDKVRSFAEQHGCLESFQNRVGYLTTYGCHTDDGTDMSRARVNLGWDFAPNSFGFAIEFRQEDGTYKHFMSGGMIFHEADKAWSIHT